MRKTKKTSKAVGLLHGFRSGLEEKIGKVLSSLGVPFLFEAYEIPYVKPTTPHRYTADFFLENGIIIESKGRFLLEDRKKHLLVQKQHPDLDIRFVFSNSRTKLSKGAKSSYAQWCEKNNFMFADKVIPSVWLDEPVNTTSLAALQKLKRK